MLEGFINSLRLKDEEEEEDYIDQLDMNDEQVIPIRSAKERTYNNGTKTRTMASREIVIAKPKKIDDAKAVIDLLVEGKSVVVDLVLIQDEMKQRVIDMIAGHCYSNHCNMEKVNDFIFMISNAKINRN